MGESKTMTLTDFLLARIAEDEATARATFEIYVIRQEADQVIWVDFSTSPSMPAPVQKVGANRKATTLTLRYADTDRVLAECEAKRRIVHDLGTCDTPEGRDGGEFFGLEIAVQHMASVYADHPDYREEWRP